MARFEINPKWPPWVAKTRADVFCEMGLMYATGRGCDVDLVAAHKWLNIAAIKGSERAAELRADLAPDMSKMQTRRGAARRPRMDDDALKTRHRRMRGRIMKQ